MNGKGVGLNELMNLLARLARLKRSSETSRAEMQIGVSGIRTENKTDVFHDSPIYANSFGSWFVLRLAIRDSDFGWT